MESQSYPTLVNVTPDEFLPPIGGWSTFFSADGRGGNIELSQTTLFSQTLNFALENLSREELLALDDNGQVDINATGAIVSGRISINDASFI